jgi:hypothetical protein
LTFGFDPEGHANATGARSSVNLIRLVVVGAGSLAGRNPPGNTGRTTMGLTELGPIPADLGDLLGP